MSHVPRKMKTENERRGYFWSNEWVSGRLGGEEQFYIQPKEIHMGTKRHIQGLFVTDEIHIEHLGTTLDLGIMPFWGRAQKSLLPKLFCSLKANNGVPNRCTTSTWWWATWINRLSKEVRSRHLAIMGSSRGIGATTSVNHEKGAPGWAAST